MNSIDVSIVARISVSDDASMENLSGLAATLRFAALKHEMILLAADPVEALSRYRRAAPFDVSARALTSERDGDAMNSLRRAVLDSSGGIVAVLDGRTAFRMRELEYGLAMIQAGSTDIIYGTVDRGRSLIEGGGPSGPSLVVRTLLSLILTSVPAAPLSGLRLFTESAAKLVFAELKGGAASVDLEILWLIRRFGLRCDYLPNAIIEADDLPSHQFTWRQLTDALRIRRSESQQLYRPPRRCPICFSSDVATWDQTNEHVIRNCRRCKCRYLAELPSLDEQLQTRNLRLRAESEWEEVVERPGKKRTTQKRAAEIRRIVSPGGRVLEIGARRGELGRLFSGEYQYVGLEISDSAARAAREQGLEVYCSTIERFVNTGTSFDAIVLSDVFEHLTNPHDVLAAIKEQLKVGGTLVLFTPDTESLTSAFTSKRWSAYKIPEHVILYSRSALIELLEHSGFEIVTATSAWEYFDHRRIMQRAREWPEMVRRAIGMLLAAAPDPLLASAGSIRVVARRRSGSPTLFRSLPSVEATHAR